MFEIIGVIAVTLVFGFLFLMSVGIMFMFSDEPIPVVRFIGLALAVLWMMLWFYLVGTHISIGIH